MFPFKLSTSGNPARLSGLSNLHLLFPATTAAANFVGLTGVAINQDCMNYCRSHAYGMQLPRRSNDLAVGRHDLMLLLALPLETSRFWSCRATAPGENR